MSIQSVIRALERELRLRRAYYPKRVERGQMTPEQAEHEIRCMEEALALARRFDIQPGEGGSNG
jgi:hypothetical protein